ncbi:unnamed protein product [Leptosia nina]|uniref:Corticotropin-releasing factor domain-containing protein n=1 Tax=Leptosia nina TaxID=320188 RepID=A0AAV1JH83_9NEOP
MPSLSIDLPMSVLRQKLSLEKERKFQALRAAANRDYLNDIGKREAAGPRFESTSETENALSLNQQPDGGSAAEAVVGSRSQADARSKPKTSGGQPCLPTKRWQTRSLGKHDVSELR